MSMSGSILSAILALIMMLTGVSGILNGSKVEQPVSFEVGFELDGDIAPLVPDRNEDVVSLLPKLANTLSLRISADASVARMEILWDGSSLAHLAAKSTEEGWEAVSTLFPTSLLTGNKETLNSQIPEEIPSADASSGSSGASSSGDPSDFAGITEIPETPLTGIVLPAALNASFEAGEDESTLSLHADLTLSEAESPLSFGLKGKFAHDAPVFGDVENLETVSLEELMQDPSQAQTFSTKVMLGGMQVVLRLATQYTEIMRLMNPPAPEKVEAPASEDVPAAEETPEAEEVPVEEQTVDQGAPAA